MSMTNASPVFSEDTNTIEQELARLDHLARMLDSRFRLPGTSIRFGLDSLIGLVPGIGDTLVAAPSVWMIWRGHVMGVGKTASCTHGGQCGHRLRYRRNPSPGRSYSMSVSRPIFATWQFSARRLILDTQSQPNRWAPPIRLD
jgi:hypothetical protein